MPRSSERNPGRTHLAASSAQVENLGKLTILGEVVENVADSAFTHAIAQVDAGLSVAKDIIANTARDLIENRAGFCRDRD